MTALSLLLGTPLVFFLLASVFVVLDFKIVVPFLAWLLPQEKRPKPENRKGIAARRSVQTQFWLSVALTVLSLWVSPTGQDSLIGFLSFAVRALSVWATFLFARHIVHGWDNRKEFFNAVGKVAEGDIDPLRGTVAAGSKKIQELRGRTVSRMDRFRNLVAGFLTGARNLKKDFDGVRAESAQTEPPAPEPPAPAPVAAEPPAEDPRAALARFTGAGAPRKEGS